MPSHGTLAPSAALPWAAGAEEQMTEADPFGVRPAEADPFGVRPAEADPFRAGPAVADPFGTTPTDPSGPTEPTGPGDPAGPGGPTGPGDPSGPADPDEPAPAPPAVRYAAPRAEEGGTASAPAPDRVGGAWTADAEDPDDADWDGDDAGTTFVGFEDGESEDELSALSDLENDDDDYDSEE